MWATTLVILVLLLSVQRSRDQDDTVCPIGVSLTSKGWQTY